MKQKQQEFLELVRKMRQYQCMWRKNPGSASLLLDLQDLEWQVDSYIAEHIQQTKLF